MPLAVRRRALCEEEGFLHRRCNGSYESPFQCFCDILRKPADGAGGASWYEDCRLRPLLIGDDVSAPAELFSGLVGETIPWCGVWAAVFLEAFLVDLAGELKIPRSICTTGPSERMSSDFGEGRRPEGSGGMSDSLVMKKL
jgi:hypothetical protein